MNMKKTTTVLSCAAALVLAGCSSGVVTAPHVASIASDVLQFNVGTARIFGDGGAGVPQQGINVAVTYRQPAGGLNPGASAVLVSSPTLTYPVNLVGPAGAADGFNATIATGPAAGEIATHSMTATPQTPNAPNITTFGTDGGAFGSGLEPFNYVGVGGVPANVTPYAVPLYDAVAGDVNQFIPGGGAPAFACPVSVPNCNLAANNGGFNGISEGLDVFQTGVPALGTYTLAVAVPGNTGTVTATQNAALTSAALLPIVTPAQPVVNTVTGAISFTLPVLGAGITEAYIQVTDFGPTAAGGVSCVGATAAAPIYYTIEITPATVSPQVLAAGLVCTSTQNSTATGAPLSSDGDEFAVQTVGFDYPAYEASYPKSLGVPAPSLVGAGLSHQSDITISTKQIWTEPIGGGQLRIQAVRRH
jgi:energy-converting hydrogenase Eha subunit A